MTADNDKITVRGAREHNLKNIDRRNPARQTRRHHRSLRLRQVVAGVRHDLRRRPASLRRIALRLRPPVPRSDGEAGCRPHRRALARDLDRPEGHQPQSALDRRHRHRDLRLPAPALRPRRPPALPRTAVARSPSSRSSRWPTQILALPDGTRLMILAPGHPRPQRRAPGRLRRDPPRRASSASASMATVRDLDEKIDLDKNKKHTIEVVVDRLVIRHEDGRRAEDHPDRVRIIDSLEIALRIGERHCRRPDHRRRARSSSPRISPAPLRHSASARSNRATSRSTRPHGACPDCTGLGTKMEFDPELIIPNRNSQLGAGRDRRPGCERPAKALLGTRRC